MQKISRTRATGSELSCRSFALSLQKITMNMQTETNYLDRNEFNFEPSDAVKEAIKNFDIKKLCFYTRIYDKGKKSIVSVLLSEKFGIDESRVLLGYGAEDLLKMAVHYFLTEPDGNKTMLIPKFSWWYYKSIADEVDGKTLQYPMEETADSFAYDLKGLQKMIAQEKPKILLVASPNNPTGNGLTPEQLAELAEMAGKETVILVDEAYASYVTGDTSYINRITESHPNAVFCRTLSKFYGLPGLRWGFGFTGKSDRMERFGKYANKYLGYDRLSEDIAIAALNSEEHYRKIAEVMSEARKMYAEKLGSLPGFKVYKSTANFILVKYPQEMKERLMDGFAEDDYKVKFMNEPDLHSHMRITLGRKEQNLKVAEIILNAVNQ